MDNPRPLIRRVGEETWRQTSEWGLGLEEKYRDLVAKWPSLIPGMGEGEWVTATEVVVPVGKIDVLAVDPEGNVVVVECKLLNNREARRKVFGQIVDYATALQGVTADELDTAMGLVERIRRIAPPGWDEGRFKAALNANLREGYLSLVVAIDRMQAEAKSMIDWLNRRTDPGTAVLGVELTPVTDGHIQLVVPHFHGEESILRKVHTLKQKWTEEDILQRLRAKSAPDEVAGFERLFEYTRKEGRLEYGSTVNPSVRGAFQIGDREVTAWVCIAWDETPAVDIMFNLLRKAGIETDRLGDLADSLSLVPDLAGIRSALEEKGYMQKPAIPLSAFGDPRTPETIIREIDRLRDSV